MHDGIPDELDQLPRGREEEGRPLGIGRSESDSLVFATTRTTPVAMKVARKRIQSHEVPVGKQQLDEDESHQTQRRI
jgi:hypothetical protein